MAAETCRLPGMTTKVVYSGPAVAPTDAKFANPPNANSVTVVSTGGGPAPQGTGAVGETREVVSMFGRSKVTTVPTSPEMLEMIQSEARRRGLPIPQALPVAAPIEATPVTQAPTPLPGSVVMVGGSRVTHHTTGSGGGLGGYGAWEGPGPNFVRHPTTGDWTSRDSLAKEAASTSQKSVPVEESQYPHGDDDVLPGRDPIPALAEHVEDKERQP